MDHLTNVHELKERVKKFFEDRDWGQFHGPKELAIGIITEASELLEPFRFKTDEQIKEILAHPEKRNHIQEELADTMMLLLRFAQMYDFDLTTAIRDKLAKNEVMYPVETSKGSNVKHNEIR